MSDRMRIAVSVHAVLARSCVSLEGQVIFPRVHRTCLVFSVCGLGLKFQRVSFDAGHRSRLLLPGRRLLRGKVLPARAFFRSRCRSPRCRTDCTVQGICRDFRFCRCSLHFGRFFPLLREFSAGLGCGILSSLGRVLSTFCGSFS